MPYPYRHFPAPILAKQKETSVKLRWMPPREPEYLIQCSPENADPELWYDVADTTTKHIDQVKRLLKSQREAQERFPGKVKYKFRMIMRETVTTDTVCTDD